MDDGPNQKELDDQNVEELLKSSSRSEKEGVTAIKTIMGNSQTPINPSLLECKNVSSKELLEEALVHKMPKMKFLKKSTKEEGFEVVEESEQQDSFNLQDILDQQPELLKKFYPQVAGGAEKTTEEEP